MFKFCIFLGLLNKYFTQKKREKKSYPNPPIHTKKVPKYHQISLLRWVGLPKNDTTSPAQKEKIKPKKVQKIRKIESSKTSLPNFSKIKEKK